MTDWRPIKGFSDYEVSEDGRIRSWRPVTNTGRQRAHPRILTGGINSRGYHRVKLVSDEGEKVTLSIHSQVCLAFHGDRPSGQVARHLDGNKSYNHRDNLAWGTHKDNSEDSRKHDTLVYGTRHHSNKLTEEEVIVIHSSLLPAKQLAKDYGVSPGMIRHIKKGRKWKHLWK